MTWNKRGTAAVVAMVALTLSACGDGDADAEPADTADVNATADAAAADEGSSESADADIVIDGEEYTFSYGCRQASDNESMLIISGTGLTGDDFYTSFGHEDRPDLVGVDHADDYWEAGGERGEISSIELDAEAGYARGEATFENEAGDTLDGAFNFDCS